MSRHNWILACRLAILLTSVVFAPLRALAQCEPEWQAFDPSTGSVPGVLGSTVIGAVFATTLWDPDGSGSETSKIVVAGSFFAAGNTMADGIALFDRTNNQWSALDTGIAGDVFALAVMPNGDLIAAGKFLIAGGVIVNNIARWNGTYWSSLGTGVGVNGGSVKTLAVLPNGDLIAGGSFADAGGVSVKNIARWTGTSWLAMSTGVDSCGIGCTTEVAALAVLSNGQLVVGGNFSFAGGVAASRIARWNPASGAWSALGTGMVNPDGSIPSVLSLAALPNGHVIAGGTFVNAGGQVVNRIARWNGSGWSPLGLGIGFSGQPVRAIAVLPNGDIVAGGAFSVAGGVAVNSVAAWNGSGWSALASGLGGEVYSLLANSNGELTAGGVFGADAGSSLSFGIACWNGAVWQPLSTGLNGEVSALLVKRDGQVVVAGKFQNAGASKAPGIALWNGVTWSRLGAGQTFGTFRALAELPNGDIVVAGSTSLVGGVAVNNIARWDGTAWAPLGAGVPGPGLARALAPVEALCVLPNGNLVAGGRRYLGLWNGSSWSPLGGGIQTSGSDYDGVSALALDANGGLIAAGRFNTAGTVPNTENIARWNGSTWSALGTGVKPGRVEAISLLPNGDLVVGGSFSLGLVGGSFAYSVARWNGASWAAMGAGISGFGNTVSSLAVLPNGNVVAGGGFRVDAGAPGNSVAMWNGDDWLPLGSGVDGNPYFAFNVEALALLPGGDLAAGGVFQTAGGVLAPFLARWAPMRPEVLEHPDALSIDADQLISLSAVAVAESGNVSFQWRRNGVPVVNGLGGASVGGGFVRGAAGILTSPTTGIPVTLTVSAAKVSDAGDYSVTFTGTCGSSDSGSASVVVAASCPADLNDDDLVDDADFLIFLVAYNILDCADPAMPSGCQSDFSRSGVVDDADFMLFIPAYNQLLCP